MEHPYDELPSSNAVLDDVKRQLALCRDSRDALEIMPMLLLGPAGIGKTHFAREVAQLLGTGLRRARRSRAGAHGQPGPA